MLGKPSIEHCPGSPSQCNKIRKRNERDTVWKRINLSLFAGNMLDRVENHKEFENKIPRTDKSVQQDRVNIQNSTTLLYTGKEQMEAKIVVKGKTYRSMEQSKSRNRSIKKTIWPFNF